ncbi:hypothetical protein [Paenibacillus sp. PK1-4R]|uniref:hypothetical protein n=1 Tax=Paenibacillus sp. PK1-4R TaxID=3049075 RepID=UPI0025A0B5DF|nr:hypothetical protein [Paenibacillus sp. PK1-4R]WJM08360.1 hypothetical protein QNO02_29925 [Paenibacillus sp. PK1-4R]
MQQFSKVVTELGNWFQTMKWYPFIRAIELQLLFGALVIKLLRELLYAFLPVSTFSTLNTIFYTIPVAALVHVVFLLTVWTTLVSNNAKYMPYALWAYAFIMLFPFTGLSLSGMITPAVYVYLGYALFRYSASSYALK